MAAQQGLHGQLKQRNPQRYRVSLVVGRYYVQSSKCRQLIETFPLRQMCSRRTRFFIYIITTLGFFSTCKNRNNYFVVRTHTHTHTHRGRISCPKINDLLASLWRDGLTWRPSPALAKDVHQDMKSPKALSPSLERHVLAVGCQPRNGYQALSFSSAARSRSVAKVCPPALTKYQLRLLLLCW